MTGFARCAGFLSRRLKSWMNKGISVIPVRNGYAFSHSHLCRIQGETDHGYIKMMEAFQLVHHISNVLCYNMLLEIRTLENGIKKWNQENRNGN